MMMMLMVAGGGPFFLPIGNYYLLFISIVIKFTFINERIRWAIPLCVHVRVYAIAKSDAIDRNSTAIQCLLILPYVDTESDDNDVFFLVFNLRIDRQRLRHR